MDDPSVRGRLLDSKLSFSLHKDPSGDVILIAVKDECGRRVYGKKRLRVNTPAILKPYEGKQALLYKELIRPVLGEVFRVRPIDFKFEGARAVKLEPYLTKTCLTIPQMYFNEHFNMYYQGIGVSFNATTHQTIKDGYVIAKITDLSHGKSYIDDFRIWECGPGLRTSKVNSVIDLLDRNAKNLNDYSYKGTMDGMMFFKEKEI